jgi:hypothetical protein
MAMQTDVQASVPITVDGQFTDQAANNLGRTRVKSVYIVPGATAGSVVFKDGGSGGSTRYDNKHGGFRYPTNVHVLMPGQGVLFQTNVYADVTDIGSVTIFYG